MRSRAFKIIIAIIGLSVAAPIAIAQRSDVWNRVVTGPGFNIDVNMASLKLETGRVFSANFKTALSKSESVADGSAPKYKTRLETIQFDPHRLLYRIRETTFLDTSGKPVGSLSSDQWKPVRAGMSSVLYNRAMTLPPFGTWKVNTYRYADGKAAAVGDPPELRKLIGGSLWLYFDHVRVGEKNCANPSFELKRIANEEFLKRTGNPLTAVGIEAREVDAVLMKCELSRADLQQTFFLQRPAGNLLLFWDGVFLELEDPAGGWGNSLLKLIIN